ncbi:MAG: hypothetical protein ACHQ9S_23350 [Candidatus Binatia bacterium]
MPSTQLFAEQSLFVVQLIPRPHLGHEPPQSTPVSSPSLTPLKQCVGTHAPLLHAWPAALQPLVLCFPASTWTHVPSGCPVVANAQERQV